MAAERIAVISGHLQASKVKMSRSPITTHVLDTAKGCPAAGVPVQLSLLSSGQLTWSVLATGVTDKDGRCNNLLSSEMSAGAGTYRVHFDTAAYFSTLGNKEPFYPYVDVVFNLKDTNQHYHIPLLLSNFSYSTYRGS